MPGGANTTFSRIFLFSRARVGAIATVPRFVSSGRSDDLVTCACYGSWLSSDRPSALGLRCITLFAIEARLLVTFLLTARFTNSAPVHAEAWSGLYSTFAGSNTLNPSAHSTHIPSFLCLPVKVNPLMWRVQLQVVPLRIHPLA